MRILPKGLLAADEPPPVTVHNAGGSSPFLLIADHAGNLIPRSLRRLGLQPAELEQHIAWDIGIAGLARYLAHELDAVLIRPAGCTDIDSGDQRTHADSGQCRSGRTR